MHGTAVRRVAVVCGGALIIFAPTLYVQSTRSQFMFNTYTHARKNNFCFNYNYSIANYTAIFWIRI